MVISWRVRRAKTVDGRIAILRLGRRHFDIRCSGRLGWEPYRPQWVRNWRLKRNPSGWTAWLDLGSRHLRVEYHQSSSEPGPKLRRHRSASVSQP